MPGIPITPPTDNKDDDAASIPNPLPPAPIPLPLRFTGVAVPDPVVEPPPPILQLPPSPAPPPPLLLNPEGSHVDGWKLTSRIERDMLGRPDSLAPFPYPPKSTGCSSHPRSKSSEFLGDEANLFNMGLTILPPRGAFVILLC